MSSGQESAIEDEPDADEGRHNAEDEEDDEKNVNYTQEVSFRVYLGH